MREQLTEIQEKILSEIERRGSFNPITSVELIEIFDVSERNLFRKGADLRSVIHALRVKGYPICASGKGYWWPKSQKELDDYINLFGARINSQQEALGGMHRGRALINDNPNVSVCA